MGNAGEGREYGQWILGRKKDERGRTDENEREVIDERKMTGH